MIRAKLSPKRKCIYYFWEHVTEQNCHSIHILAREIKQICSELGLSFLSKHSFSLDEIGDVASFDDFCTSFLKELLKWLLYYSPIEHEIIQSLDFVTLPRDIEGLKRKLLLFNSTFKVVDDERKIIQRSQ